MADASLPSRSARRPHAREVLGLGGAWRGGAGAGRRRHRRPADPADPGVPAGPAAGDLDHQRRPDPDDLAADQEAAGVHRLPDGAAGHHPLPAGAEHRLDPPDPRPRPRGRPRRGPHHRGLRQADDGRQLRHRRDRLRHPGDRELRGHHQGLGPDRRGGRPLHPGLHARQADGHRRRPVGGPDRRDRGQEAPQGAGAGSRPSSGPWTAPPSSCAATPSPA